MNPPDHRDGFFQPGDRLDLFRRRSLFLSASVPGGKTYPRSDVHLATARGQWIRDAVLATVRLAFEHDLNVVFGAHPAISPMVLRVASQFPRRPGEPRVLVFQSNFFAGRFPEDTLTLADGTMGARLIIEAQPAASPSFADSILAMRQAMFRSPNLVGAVFIGGMDGIVDEAMLFKTINADLPTWAFGSTGGACRDLLDLPPSNFSTGDFCGEPYAPVPVDELRAEGGGYSPVVRRILRAIEQGISAGTLVPRPP